MAELESSELLSFSDEFDRGHAKEGADEEDGELSTTTTFSDLDEAALDEMFEVVDVSSKSSSTSPSFWKLFSTGFELASCEESKLQ